MASNLAAQIRATWGGNWDASGVDRAEELARLLQANGISDLSQVQITPQQGMRTETGYSEAGQDSWQVPTTTYGIKANGQDLSFLGDVNNNGSLTLGGNSPTHPDGTLGWSAAGHGNVSYQAVTGPDGKVSIQPAWNSSSDAGDARTMAQIYGTVLGAGAGAGAFGGAAGGATAAAPYGVSLSAADVAGMALPELSTSLGSMPAVAGGAAGGAVGAGLLSDAAGNGLKFGGQSSLGGTGSGLSTTPGMQQALAPTLKAAGEAPVWAQLAGTALGAMSGKDQQQTSSRDPWGPAQPFLQDLIGQGQQLSQAYQQQPFSQQQQTAYNNLGGLLNAINTGAGGLLAGMNANASGANNFDRSNPRKALQGSNFSLGNFAPGLLQFFGGK